MACVCMRSMGMGWCVGWLSASPLHSTRHARRPPGHASLVGVAGPCRAPDVSHVTTDPREQHTPATHTRDAQRVCGSSVDLDGGIVISHLSPEPPTMSGQGRPQSQSPVRRKSLAPTPGSQNGAPLSGIPRAILNTKRAQSQAASEIARDMASAWDDDREGGGVRATGSGVNTGRSIEAASAAVTQPLPRRNVVSRAMMPLDASTCAHLTTRPHSPSDLASRLSAPVHHKYLLLPLA